MSEATGGEIGIVSNTSDKTNIASYMHCGVCISNEVTPYSRVLLAWMSLGPVMEHTFGDVDIIKTLNGCLVPLWAFCCGEFAAGRFTPTTFDVKQFCHCVGHYTEVRKPDLFLSEMQRRFNL